MEILTKTIFWTAIILVIAVSLFLLGLYLTRKKSKAGEKNGATMYASNGRTGKD